MNTMKIEDLAVIGAHISNNPITREDIYEGYITNLLH